MSCLPRLPLCRAPTQTATETASLHLQNTHCTCDDESQRPVSSSDQRTNAKVLPEPRRSILRNPIAPRVQGRRMLVCNACGQGSGESIVRSFSIDDYGDVGVGVVQRPLGEGDSKGVEGDEDVPEQLGWLAVARDSMDGAWGDGEKRPRYGEWKWEDEGVEKKRKRGSGREKVKRMMRALLDPRMWGWQDAYLPYLYGPTGY